MGGGSFAQSRADRGGNLGHAASSCRLRTLEWCVRRTQSSYLWACRHAACRPNRALGFAPFALTERSGKLYGHGVSDDKASMLLPILAAEALFLAGDEGFYDDVEEIDPALTHALERPTFDEKQYLRGIGASSGYGEPGYSTLAR